MKKALFTLLVVLAAQQAFAWGQAGHRIIGQIAEDRLEASAKRKIDRLLGNAGVAMVANWGDFVKSDPAYKEYGDWHYTNIDSGLTRAAFNVEAMRNDQGECIYRVAFLIDHLKQNPNDTAMLKMLIHIAGDMFMPLHLGRPNDRGGNDIQVKWFGSNVRLHALWDDRMIESQRLSYSEYTAYLERYYQPKNLTYSPELLLDKAWVTYQFAERIYAAKEQPNNSYRYIFDFLAPMERQLVAGGEMLAAILNEIY